MNYCVYPYSNDVKELIQYINENSKTITVTTAVNTNLKNNHNTGNITFCDDLREAIVSVDGCIFLQSHLFETNYSELVNSIKLCIENQKNVICCAKLKDNDIIYFESNEHFNYLGKCSKISAPSIKQYSECKCIAVGIGKAFSPQNTLNTLVSLFKEYEELGYKVSAITSDYNCKLIGFYEYPQYMFSTQCSELDKIIGLNSFIQEIENHDNPDIILFDIPYGLIENAYEINYFGIYAYMLTRACKMDYFIFQTICGFVDNNSTLELFNTLKYKYDCEADAILIENLVIDIEESSENEKICFRQIDYSSAQRDLSIWKSIRENSQVITDQGKKIYMNIVTDSIDVLSNEIEEI